VGGSQRDSDVTQLLAEWSRGDRDAVERLIPLVYGQLKSLAASHMRRERGHHTLQPTALIHETFLRLVNQNSVTWRCRKQFFAVASRAMRQILVDHARRRSSVKRGSQAVTVSLSHGDARELADPLSPAAEILCDVLTVDSALEELNEFDPELARIVELRYFAGFTIEETAGAMGISTATVKRAWATARAWLFDRIRSTP
jgi:RNA polymerase sigma factor (TIGR02999 family)